MAKNRSLMRIFKRKSTDEASRFYAMFPGILGAQAYITGMDNDNDDDASSIESFSTMATVDDNPGTGRVLDTYFFQPAGRRIERLAMRFTIRHLHPSRIEAYIAGGGIILYSMFDIKFTLSIALREIDRVHLLWPTVVFGPTVISGLKSLVRQAQ